MISFVHMHELGALSIENVWAPYVLDPSTPCESCQSVNLQHRVAREVIFGPGPTPSGIPLSGSRFK